MAVVEVIDPETGEVTTEEYDMKVVSLESQTRFQREARAMVKREFDRLSRTYMLPMDETLKMTAGAAQLIGKHLINDALRALVEDLQPKQVSLPIPAERGSGARS